MKHKNLFKVILVLVMALVQLPLAHPAQAATYWVTNTSDSGAGSLRQAIFDANAPGDDYIYFNIPMSDPGCNAGTGICTIRPASALPNLLGSYTIVSGFTQPGAAVPTTTPAVLKIELDGTNAGAASGLTITGDHIVIAGLVINRFSQNGVYITGSAAHHNGIAGSHIGTDVAGTVDLGNGGIGVRIRGSDDNIIGGTVAGNRNVISGNNGNGILISDGENNVVSGNYIGTDATGTADLGNGGYGGVYITVEIEGASNNTIGGDSAPERNVISGNDHYGVYISGSDTTGNTISGNYIGTDVNGTADLGNWWSGVHIEGASNNTVGGDTEGERNIIAGNDDYGVDISGSGTTGNTISGNYIGTDATGAATLGNDLYGVKISGIAQNNIIGGDTVGERNVISGNNQHGVYISDYGTTGNVVAGNYIGTNAAGSAALGNGSNGVDISSSAQNNTIGGDAAGERNVISGNNNRGVDISGSGTTGNIISGNYIGTNAAGTAALGNNASGVYIGGGAHNNTIGGDTAGKRNIIAGNDQYGIYISDSDTPGSTVTDNVVAGNYIGTDATGGTALGNGDGVYIGRGARNNTIGGDTTGERNVISGNDQRGVYIVGIGSSATGNTISGNYIGIEAAGAGDLGNGSDGVAIGGSVVYNTVGGDTTGERNVISGNSGNGVDISGSGATGNTVSGNYVGLSADGLLSLGNDQHGVYLENGAQNNTIGGDTAGERNVISSNGLDGVSISGGSTTGNVVSGNYIGTHSGGGADRGNDGSGIRLQNGAQNNTIGGDTAGRRNVISSNNEHGVCLDGTGPAGNTVRGNYIGTDVGGATGLGNSWSGISIGNYGFGPSNNNTIRDNLISGNSQHGVVIEDSATGNHVFNNTIGTNAAGETALGNTGDGVHLADGAFGNTIGGSQPSQGNLISGNVGDGIDISGGGTISNTVAANFIGTAADGAHDRGNGQNGVYIHNGASNNTIGGDRTPGPSFTDPRNLISGNNGHGVHLEDADNNTVLGNLIGLTGGGGKENDLGNTNSGVAISAGAQNNLIGGDVEGEQNIISGNDQHGVLLTGAGTSNNTVSANIIGTNSGGTVDWGNTQDGIHLAGGAHHNLIGGDIAEERNVISGNDQHGVGIEDADDNTVRGNFIGTTAGGGALGNTQHGIYIYSGAQHNILGPGNVIAHNGGDGVEVNGGSTSDNTITQNSIYSDTMGIDLASGANGDIAPPVIITTTQGSVNIVGTACAGCTVEVFCNSDTDGEGEAYVGHTTATSGGAFTLTVSSLSQPYLTATATDTDDGTSEFSEVFEATVELAPGSGPVYLPIVVKNN